MKQDLGAVLRPEQRHQHRGQANHIPRAHAAGIDHPFARQYRQKLRDQRIVITLPDGSAHVGDQLDLPFARPADAQHNLRPPERRLARQRFLEHAIRPTTQRMRDVDGNLGLGIDRAGPGQPEREPRAEHRIGGDEILHLEVVAGIAVAHDVVVLLNESELGGAAETLATAMLDEQPADRAMPATLATDLLAPVHLFAIAAPEHRIERRHPRKPAPRDRHAETDPCRHVDLWRRQTRGDAVDGVGLARAKHRALTNDGGRIDLGVVRQRRHARDRWIGKDRTDQPSRPARGNEGVGVEQNDRALVRATESKRAGKPGIDRADEAEVARVFVQLDPMRAPPAGNPFAQEGAHPRIGRAILADEQAPGQIGVAAHPVEHLFEQIEGVVDRKDDGDPKLGNRLGGTGRKQPGVEQLTAADPIEPEAALDLMAPARIAVVQPAQGGRQGAQAIGQKSRPQGGACAPALPETQGMRRDRHLALSRLEDKPGHVGMGEIGKLHRQVEFEPDPIIAIADTSDIGAQDVGNDTARARAEQQRHPTRGGPAGDMQAACVDFDPIEKSDLRARIVEDPLADPLNDQMLGLITGKQALKASQHCRVPIDSHLRSPFPHVDLADWWRGCQSKRDFHAPQ